jgi:hypothetical protein
MAKVTSSVLLCVVLALVLAVGASADCIQAVKKGTGYATTQIDGVRNAYTLDGVADMNYDGNYGAYLNVTMEPRCSDQDTVTLSLQCEFDNCGTSGLCKDVSGQNKAPVTCIINARNAIQWWYFTCTSVDEVEATGDAQWIELVFTGETDKYC